MSDKQTLDSRPLSPHLQVYKPQITSVLSISHRISGVFLSLGLLTMSLFIVLLALGKDSFFLWILFSSSFLGNKPAQESKICIMFAPESICLSICKHINSVIFFNSLLTKSLSLLILLKSKNC